MRLWSRPKSSNSSSRISRVGIEGEGRVIAARAEEVIGAEGRVVEVVGEGGGGVDGAAAELGKAHFPPSRLQNSLVQFNNSYCQSIRKSK